MAEGHARQLRRERTRRRAGTPGRSPRRSDIDAAERDERGLDWAVDERLDRVYAAPSRNRPAKPGIDSERDQEIAAIDAIGQVLAPPRRSAEIEISASRKRQ